MNLQEGETYYAICTSLPDIEESIAYAAELSETHKCSIIIVKSIEEIPIEARPRPAISRTDIELTLTCDMHNYKPLIDTKTSYVGHERPYKYHK